MGKPYRECPHCGAHLDAGERCDCGEPEQQEQPAEEERPRMRLIAICREVDKNTGRIAVYPLEKEMDDMTVTALTEWSSTPIFAKRPFITGFIGATFS